MREALIEFKGLSKFLSGKAILSDINLEVKSGEILGIIGSSGAGKTTLLRTLIGFYKIDQGDIIYQGKSITNNIKEIRTIMGFSSQDNCVYDELTSFENLFYFGRLHGMDKDLLRSNAAKVLDLVKLTKAKDSLAGELSGGMLRRLDIACALIHNPHILIMDEPTYGLDPLLRRHIWQLITRIKSEGSTIIVSSHELSDIEHICDRICIVSKGKIIANGTIDEIRETYSTSQEIQIETFPGDYDKIQADLILHGMPKENIFQKDHKLIIFTSQPEYVLRYLLQVIETNQEKIIDVSVHKPSLTEVFEAISHDQ